MTPQPIPTPLTDNFFNEHFSGATPHMRATYEFCQNQERSLIQARDTLEKISKYDDEPIWGDDRDDAADEMLNLAREALDNLRK